MDEDGLFDVIAYLLPIIGGVLVLLVKKGSRFHAIQSILFWAAVIVISISLEVVEAIFRIIPVVGKVIGSLIGIVSMLFGLGVLVVWLFLMWKAYEKEKYMLPVLGSHAKKL